MSSSWARLRQLNQSHVGVLSTAVKVRVAPSPVLLGLAGTMSVLWFAHDLFERVLTLTMSVYGQSLVDQSRIRGE